MGIYRSTPLTDKNTVVESNESIGYAACGMQGWRVNMEDAHIANINLGDDIYIFGVFDGHGGMEVSEYVKRHFIEELLKNSKYKEGDYV
jgi:serine/threonine protein phosphatase PrpC